MMENEMIFEAYPIPLKDRITHLLAEAIEIGFEVGKLDKEIKKCKKK